MRKSSLTLCMLVAHKGIAAKIKSRQQIDLIRCVGEIFNLRRRVNLVCFVFLFQESGDFRCSSTLKVLSASICFISLKIQIYMNLYDMKETRKNAELAGKIVNCKHVFLWCSVFLQLQGLTVFRGRICFNILFRNFSVLLNSCS